ncbi:MAG: sigma 54-interacting transcriptional regulator [Deltaproteobacteria bacterium]|nr:sigma 54-interacting transcriptional regulator [Deltaproteobacteria bacterium]
MNKPRLVDNRYKIIRELGSGLSGEVLLVEDAGGQKALKFLKRIQMGVSREEALANFKNEFSILSELNHPGIARILDFGFDPLLMKYYFTSELVEGADFLKATEGKSIDEIELLAVQVFRALNYLHSRGIYHLDIKPQNILVQNPPQPPFDKGGGGGISKLIDFGLSALSRREKVGGTPAYMAPEVPAGGNLDGRTDLYSFGVVLYKVLTRNNPFAASKPQDTIKNHQTLTPPPPSEVNPQVPKYWDLILMRLLEKNPSDRYPEASVVIRDLNFLAGKKYEFETAETRLSYVPEKGALVGRRPEMLKFRALFETVFSPSSPTLPRLLIVEGEVGSGKSRLLTEFKYYSQLHNVPTLSLKEEEEGSHPPPYMVLIDEPENIPAERVGALLAHSVNKKVLIVWAAPTAPSALSHCEKIRLNPFDAVELAAYLTAVTGLADPPPGLVDEIFRRTGGNPLFVTELLKTLLRHDLLLDASGRWAGPTLEDMKIDFEKIKAPKTVSELLLRRLEKLDAEERKIVEWMAVFREALSPSTLELLAEIRRPQTHLLNLAREDILSRQVVEGGYFFKNILMGDVIYEGLPLEARRKMHDAAARYLEKTKGSEEKILLHRGKGTGDKEAVSALCELAGLQTKKGGFGEAEKILETAWGRAQKMDPKTQIAVEIQLAESQVKVRRYTEAINHYLHLKGLLDRSLPAGGAGKERIAVYEKLGDLYARLDQYPKALELFDAAIGWLDPVGVGPPGAGPPGAGPPGLKPGDRTARMILENHRANIFMKSGKLDEAEALFRKNQLLWEKGFTAEEKTGVANNHLAYVLILQKKYGEAKVEIDKQIAFFRKNENPYWLARAHYLYGDLYYQQMIMVHTGKERERDKAESISAFEECHRIAKGIDSFDTMLRAYNGIANLYFHEKEYVQSREYYERALALARRQEDYEAAAAISLNLGNIFRLQKQYADAYSYLVYTVNTLEGADPKNYQIWFFLLNACDFLAEVHRETGEFEKALALLSRAEKILGEQPPLAPYRFYIHLDFSKTYAQQGKREEAVRHYEKAVQMAKTDTEKEELKEFRKTYLHQEATMNTDAGSTEAKKETSEFETILHINQMINAEHNLEALMKIVLRYALELSKAEAGLILLLTSEGELSVAASLNTTMSEELSRFSTSVARRVVETGEEVVLADAIVDEQFKSSDSIILNEMKSILCLPIRSRNRIVGVFYLDNRYQAGAFAGVNRKVLSAFCDQVGISIENARLIEGYREANEGLEKQLEQTNVELSEVKERLKKETSLYLTRYSYSQIISKSKAMQETFKILDKITETNLSVYLFGASGTGKELIARALHYNNPQRAARPFVAINCGAIPQNLIESELFGYKAGSFTGATRDKKGLIAEADGGTLFLDEIGELETSLQVKLLRVLQESEVRPIGDTASFKVDVRVVSASHRDIQAAIGEGKFREDLFYRLCQITLSIPPLSERKEDIPVLAEHFVEKFRKENKIKKPVRIAPPFLKILLNYDWPGNVRELENLISVACALREGDSLAASSIPPNHPAVRAGGPTTGVSSSSLQSSKMTAVEGVAIDPHNTFDPQKTWADYEKVILAKCYQTNEFKKTASAEMIGISPSTLYKKIDESGLDDRNNPVYQDPFVYEKGKSLKDYIPLVFQAALKAAGDKPYTAIRQLGVSQGYFYKIIKTAKAA